MSVSRVDSVPSGSSASSTAGAIGVGSTVTDLLSVRVPQCGTGVRARNRTTSPRPQHRRRPSSSAAAELREVSESAEWEPMWDQEVLTGLFPLITPEERPENTIRPREPSVSPPSDDLQDPWAELPVDPDFDAAWERWVVESLPEDVHAAEIVSV